MRNALCFGRQHTYTNTPLEVSQTLGSRQVTVKYAVPEIWRLGQVLLRMAQRLSLVRDTFTAVSYTHLTLPTILLV